MLKDVALSIYRQIQHIAERPKENFDHEFDHMRATKNEIHKKNRSVDIQRIWSERRDIVRSSVNSLEQQSFVARLVTQRLALAQIEQKKV
jgi:hypothetical protein